jgi:hypothetical protein
MLGESLQRFAIVLIGVAVFFELQSTPTSLGFLAMLAALLLGLLGVIIDVVDLTPVPDDPRPHAD